MSSSTSTDIYHKKAVLCEICRLEFKSLNSLSKHIVLSHKHTNLEEYYNNFISKVSSICICECIKKFRGLGEGYRQFCSPKCRSSHITPTKYWLGKKQSQETISKRIANTNQKSKEKKRKLTCIKKYGVDNPSKTKHIANKISNGNIGKKMPIRTKEHTKKILVSKEKNGTLKHKTETKDKIKASVNAIYQSDNPPITISESNYKHHNCGYFNNIYYRSSYELKFLNYCEENCIVCESAENQTFRVPYIFNDKNHFYYPDFYLPQYDCVVEVKPISMLNHNKNPAKIKAAKNRYKKKFFLVTENELLNLKDFFTELIDCMKTTQEHF